MSAAETTVLTETAWPLSVRVPSVGRRVMMTLSSWLPSAPSLKLNSAAVKVWLLPTSTLVALSAATGASLVPITSTVISCLPVPSAETTSKVSFSTAPGGRSWTTFRLLFSV
ncbi:Uncharacterised protein [Achromobacter xylosoxidans]|nr:Uncharacterised protein [Achromobacter xylosoxidans]